MLSAPERWLFLCLALLSAALAARGLERVRRVIRRRVHKDDPPTRLQWSALLGALTLRTVFQRGSGAPDSPRRRAGFAHAAVAWGFLVYLLVNLGDLLEGFMPGSRFLGETPFGGPYRLLADLATGGILVGMFYLLLRRFHFRAAELEISPRALLHPRARSAIRRESALVGGFILVHVGMRLLGAVCEQAAAGPEPWQPIAGGMALLLQRMVGVQTAAAFDVARHTSWWLSFGAILAFLPYLPFTKHIHLFFAPLGFLLRPARQARAEMSPLDLLRDTLGAGRLEELSWTALLDAYACIQCSRCQDACPAHAAGSRLSPSALEVNKRYALNDRLAALADGAPSGRTLLESAVPADALWACTSCAACVAACPVGNEPLRDLQEVRRFEVLTEGRLPEAGATALRNLAVAGNPWGQAPSRRAEWSEGLEVRTLAPGGETDVLFWVGCSASYDGRNREIARATARLLTRAGVEFAILGAAESCTGDPARRLGDEALFQTQRDRNRRTLSERRFRRIVTSCSHCFHALKQEYGENWDVRHHSQLLSELLAAGRLRPARGTDAAVTFHDSCYLGRYQGEYSAPRSLLEAVPGLQIVEMPRSREQGFCCGGGGGCAWVDTPAERRIPDVRLEEALGTGARVVATACPFCLTMFAGSPLQGRAGLELKDVAEILDAATETDTGR
jgi:Fe-S oxidoreductase